MNSRRFVVPAAVAAIMLAGAVNVGAEPGQSDVRVAPAPEQQMDVETAPSRFVPLTPQRVLDTRNSGTPAGAGDKITVDLSGQTPASAVAVVLNVTGADPAANTYVTVYPSDQRRPLASNLSLVRGQTRANAATVALSPDRHVTLYNSMGSTHLVVDITGYYATDQGAGFTTEPTPERVLDTRFSGPVGPGGFVDVQLNLPSSDQPTAAVFNVTAVNATHNTFVTAYTYGQPRPLSSNLNIGPGEVVPNQVTVPLDSARKMRLFNRYGNVHLVVDLIGYYRNGSGSDFVAVLPVRWMDTRPGNGVNPEGHGITLTGFDSNVTAVAATLTGTNPTAAQHIKVWPSNAPSPNTSNLNLVPGQTAANAVTVGVGYSTMHEDYAVTFANNAGYADLIFDIAGFFVTTD